MAKRLTVIEETKTGFNTKIRDNYRQENMTIRQVVKKVENGEYPNYHVRVQKETGNKYIASNPDRSEKNNLD